MANTNDFAIVSEEFSTNIMASFWVLYDDFIREFNSYCGNVRVFPGRKIINQTVFRKIQFRNKSNVIYDYVAYYDVSDFVKTAVPNVSQGVKKAVLQEIIELGGIVIIDGRRMEISDLQNKVLK